MIDAHNGESAPSIQSLKDGLQNYESEFIFQEIHNFILNSNFMPDTYEDIPKNALILKKMIKKSIRLFR